MDELQLLSVGYVVFAVLIGAELAWSKGRSDGGYRLSQVVVNIGHGAVFQVFDGLTKALVLVPFVFVSQWAPWTLPVDAVWGWVLGLLIYDFASYWRHRHHHEIGALWAIHGVHHAAADFNLAAALRQALFQNISGWVWMAPLGLVLPLEMLVGLAVFDYLYQFVQHTRYVPKLGPLEWVFNTPSHHRVHHGTEPQYLDKNYGGILIIWDRLFGTFEEEGVEPTYGLTKPLVALNPVWGNLALWWDLAGAASKADSWRDAGAILVGPPETVDRLVPGVVVRDGRPLEDAEVEGARLRYVAVSYAGLPVLLGALAWVPAEEWGLRIALSALVVGSALVPGALLERRSWAEGAEGVRFVSAVGLTVAAVGAGQGLVAGALAVSVGAIGAGVVVGLASRTRQLAP